MIGGSCAAWAISRWASGLPCSIAKSNRAATRFRSIGFRRAAFVFGAFFYAVYATGWSHTVRDYWVLPPLFAIILALAFDRGIVARLFQSTPLRLLGEWSFAIYMGQTTFLQLLRVAEQRLYPNPAPQWAHTIHIVEPAVLLILCTDLGRLALLFCRTPGQCVAPQTLAIAYPPCTRRH